MSPNRKAKLGAGRESRLTARNDISRVFREGRRASDPLITLYALRRADPSAVARAGVAVSSRHGKAVRRNRIKRLSREAFRLLRPELPRGWDYMIVPRIGSDLTVRELMRSLKRLTARITERQRGKGEEA